MRKARFTELQIIAVLKSVEAGGAVKDACRAAGIFGASYYNWKAKFGGIEASDIKKMKDLEDENRQLKLNFRRKGKQRLPVRNPAPLATPEAMNQSGPIDFMHDALVCGRRFQNLQRGG